MAKVALCKEYLSYRFSLVKFSVPIHLVNILLRHCIVLSDDDLE